MGKRRRVAERRKTSPAVLAGTIAVVVAGAGVGAYALFGGSGDGGGKPAAGTESVRTGPLSAKEVATASRTFLDAWQEGRVAAAAGTTDDADTARKALTGYFKDARVKDVALTPGTAAEGRVPFSVEATVSYDKLSEKLTYDSALTVVRRAGDGEPVVRWQPSVVHPDLQEGDTLVTGEAGTPPIKALDREGGELTTEKYPSLGLILDSLREKYGESAGGKAGIELRVVRAEADKDDKAGDAASEKAGAADKTVLELSEGTPGTVETTLSPDLQAAAEEQVAEKARSSVVVLRASTGEILAAANASKGFNTAFQGSLAPGSTMKVVTSSMLIEKDLASTNKAHPCPKYFTYGGWKFQNDDKFQIKDGTFKASFARSCNTAFISQAPELDDDSLTEQAQQVFGLGLNNWAVGVSTFDGSVPVQSKAQMAAELIGQGGVRMNPLNMASVSATVKSGVFHQPYLVSPEVDGRQLAKAARTMSADTLSQLRELMAYTAAYGTAAEAMSGVGGDVGAKTGSAEVDGQKKPNGWFTAYRGDLAAAGVVQAAGHGGSTAGPIVAALLKQGG
ncbi:penicillin-binding transpeptidase domain-containing protein [Streptomyces sp. NPDC003832]